MELSETAWQVRNRDGPGDGVPPQDWTTGANPNSRLMLNTDICLAFDLDDRPICCTRGSSSSSVSESSSSDDEVPCIDRQRCPRYDQSDARMDASEAIEEYRGGEGSTRFYDAFADAWKKATTVGQSNLSPLAETCESI